MNGLMSRYRESLKNTQPPVLPSQLASVKLDLKGLMKYAKDKKISPAQLTEAEKLRFMLRQSE